MQETTYLPRHWLRAQGLSATYVEASERLTKYRQVQCCGSVAHSGRCPKMMTLPAGWLPVNITDAGWLMVLCRDHLYQADEISALEAEIRNGF